jgi:hypothetical protein
MCKSVYPPSGTLDYGSAIRLKLRTAWSPASSGKHFVTTRLPCFDCTSQNCRPLHDSNALHKIIGNRFRLVQLFSFSFDEHLVEEIIQIFKLLVLCAVSFCKYCTANVEADWTPLLADDISVRPNDGLTSERTRKNYRFLLQNVDIRTLYNGRQHLLFPANKLSRTDSLTQMYW